MNNAITWQVDRLDEDDGWTAVKMFPHPDDGEMYAGMYAERLAKTYGAEDVRYWKREPWRVGAWGQDGEISIEFRDGETKDIDCGFDFYTDSAGDEIEDMGDWCERLWIESGEDCDKAGIKLDPDDECYHFDDGDLPTRWRDGDTMRPACSREMVYLGEGSGA